MIPRVRLLVYKTALTGLLWGAAFPLLGDVSAPQRNALVAFYEAANGDEWKDNTNWLSGDPCSNSWFGLLCNAANTQVERIHIWGNNLSGVIAPELGEIESLEQLILIDNMLTGGIPESLFALPFLEYLWVAQNDLSGPLPASIGTMPKIELLLLGSNRFDGNIPPEIGQLGTLRSLDMSDNLLVGAVPGELGNLRNLESLRLAGNMLTGEIPSSLGDLAQLEELMLINNRLDGSIPSELGQLGELKALLLAINQLDGPIPAALGQLSNLQVLWLHRNELSGSIPPELGNLQALGQLLIHQNKLSGSIPTEITTLLNLSALHLNHNKLSGVIPEQLGQLEELEQLFLQANRLVGVVPASLQNLTKLAPGNLDLSWNALFTENTSLRNFLDSISPGWDESQTLAPTELRIRLQSESSVMIDWQPQGYLAGGGGYRVLRGATASGPFQLVKSVPGKTTEFTNVAGLNPGRHYFRISTRTSPHFYNLNEVVSDVSDFIGVTVPHPLPQIEINAGLNDAWVRDDAPFQGLFITVYEQLELVFVAWFTFDSASSGGDIESVFGAADQRWVTAVGPITGTSAELRAELTSGGRIHSSEPLAEQVSDYGSVRITFQTCSSGTVDYEFPAAGLNGSFSIQRAMESSIALCEALSK